MQRPAAAPIPLPSRDPDLAALPLIIALGAIGAGAVLALQGQPTYALLVPIAIGTGIFCARRPAGAATLMVLFLGIYGSWKAFVPVIPATFLADGLMGALWIAVIYAYLSGRRTRATHLFPGLALVLLFVGVSAVDFATSGSSGAAADSFHLTPWHFLAIALIALAPWSPSVFRRLSRGVVLVAVLVCGYCVLRYVIGSSSSEFTIAHQTHPEIPASQIRFFGSFPSAQELCAWTAALIPFLFALMLAWRGRWRMLAAVGMALSIAALLAADVRTGILAAGAGLIVTAIGFFATKSLAPGRRLGTSFVVILAVVGMATAGYGLMVATSPQRAARLSSLFHPQHDRDYQIRQQRWAVAWDETLSKPFGNGLGTTGAPAARHHVTPVGPTILDSSYLQIGIEQGWVVLALFALTLLTMLGNLLVGGIRTRDPSAAGLALGAAGTLTSLVVLMYGSTFIAVPSITIGWVIIGLGAAQLTSGGAGASPHRTEPR